MTFKFNLLLANDAELASTRYQNINEQYLTQTLQHDLALPICNNKPFVFSCFALSVDGRLCYPDLTSGFAIAKFNDKATEMERFADWWILSLGRAISDAVIIGSNSLRHEHGNFAAQLDIPELISLRKKMQKPESLLHIVVVRDAAKIDWLNEAVLNDESIRLLIYCEKLPDELQAKLTISQSYQPHETKQIIQVANLALDTLLTDLYTKGIKTVLNESPYYHHQLQELGVLDEAWLNTSAVYIGGNVASLGSNNQSFTAKQHPHYSILTLHSIGYSFLYTRYKINY